MSDWRQWCSDASVVVEGDVATVRFATGRKQRVTVVAGPHGWTLSSVVQRGGTGAFPHEVLRRLALRNRSSIGVGCRLDPETGIVAQAHVPAAGVTAAEFTSSLRIVAAEADRMEFLLTAEDNE